MLVAEGAGAEWDEVKSGRWRETFREKFVEHLGAEVVPAAPLRQWSDGRSTPRTRTDGPA